MKTKLPSILLSADFYTKPRNRKWIKEQGAEAVIVLQAFWIASSQEKDCKISKDEACLIPYPLPLPDDRILQILTSAVEVGLLDQDEDSFFNSQIVSDHKNFQLKHQNYRKGRIQRESSQDSARILAESSQDSPRIILNTDSDSEVLNIEVKEEGVQGEKPVPDYLTRLETRVFVETWRMPELELWFKRSGFDDPEKAIKYAATIVNGSYEKRGVSGEDAPAKCYSDLISWGNREAQNLKKTKLDTQAAEARRERATGPAPPPRPKSLSVNEILSKQLGELKSG